MARPRIEISTDSLFEVTKEPEEKGEKTTVAIEELIPFKNHPSKLHSTEQLNEMAESIAQIGITDAILVRPHPDGTGYEIIAGHNRVAAAKLAGLVKIPATIKEMDDDTAIIAMVDSNFQKRTEYLPSEKAMAYKMKLEAIKRQGERSDLTSFNLARS